MFFLKKKARKTKKEKIDIDCVDAVVVDVDAVCC